MKRQQIRFVKFATLMVLLFKHLVSIIFMHLVLNKTQSKMTFHCVQNVNKKSDKD